MVVPSNRLFVLGSFVNACCAQVGRLPRAGECLTATRFTSEPGGKGFNVALGAHRLGTAVDTLVAIGDDAFGGLAEAAFTEAGLSSALLRRYPVATGAGVGIIQADGETLVAVYPGANLSLCAEDVHWAAPRIAAAALVTAQFEIAEAPILAAFALARSAGVPTLLNPSPFRMPSAALLAKTAIMVVNEREARDLAAALAIAAYQLDADAVSRLSAALRRYGPTTLVVTLGERGAIAVEAGVAPLVQPAFAVAAIDTLGAGDAFIAGLAAAFVAGAPLFDALRQAAATGGLTATRSGTFSALPTATEVTALLGRAEAHEASAHPDVSAVRQRS